jgi:hypothetical protein
VELRGYLAFRGCAKVARSRVAITVWAVWIRLRLMASPPERLVVGVAEVSEKFKRALFDHYKQHRDEILRGARAQDPVGFLFLTPELARLDKYLGIKNRDE